MKKYVFKNQEVNKVIQWWLDNYGYNILDTENGIFMEDLQDESNNKYTTEEDIIEFFIEQIENKLQCNKCESFEKDLEILKSIV